MPVSFFKRHLFKILIIFLRLYSYFVTIYIFAYLEEILTKTNEIVNKEMKPKEVKILSKVKTNISQAYLSGKETNLFRYLLAIFFKELALKHQNSRLICSIIYLQLQR